VVVEFLIPAAPAAVGYSGYVIYRAWPKGIREVGIVGMPDVGKTVLHYCLGKRKGEATMRLSRKPTEVKGDFYTTNIYGVKKKLKLNDYPGGVESIPEQQADLNPVWWIHMIDVFTWDSLENWKILKALAEELDTDEYHEMNDPIEKTRYNWLRREKVTKKKGGGGVKLITIVLNKVDQLKYWSKRRRSEYLEKIADWYTQDHPDNPLNALRDDDNPLDITIEFIALSVHEGKYYKYGEFDEGKKDFKDYVKESVKHQL